MSQLELLNTAVKALDQTGIPYMLTGSLVSSMQGQPRSTHDIDIVVAMSQEHVDQMIACFPPPKFYVSETAMREAIQHRRMFNVLDNESGDNCDFWLLTDEAFDQSRFSRRISEDVAGTSVTVSTPEDTILMKLRWAVLSGGSEKQFGDARSVYELQSEQLDRKYLTHWIELLEIQGLWQQLIDECE